MFLEIRRCKQQMAMLKKTVKLFNYLPKCFDALFDENDRLIGLIVQRIALISSN